MTSSSSEPEATPPLDDSSESSSLASSPVVSRVEAAQSIASDERAPLSYADLRRFFALLIGFGMAALLVRALGDILMLFVVSFFVAMVLNPFVSWLERRGVKRGLAVALTMLALVGTVVGVGFLVVPPVVEQTSALVKQVGQNSESVQKQALALLDRYPQLRQLLPAEIRDSNNFNAISKQLTPLIQERLRVFVQSAGPGVGKNVVATTLGLVGGIFTGVIGLLLVAFILGNPKPMVTGFLAVVPARHRDAAGRSIARIEQQMLAWIRATLINGILTGVSTSILLYFIGLPSVIVFGVLSFFGEFVPNLGPIAASLPALFVAAGQGTTTFMLTLAAILFVQQVESNVLVPFIMGRELDLHPVTIVFFALGMGALFGIAGAILAVPLAAVTKVLVDEFVIKPNHVPVKDIEEHAETLISRRQWSA
ncbi:putative transport protein [Abditibacteriota bacterium]|nr:putative transport protein [Abditibacteriota bacterium]